jgi:hypothetical protein
MKYRKKPVVIEAHQWFKNGDHPEDYTGERTIFDKGDMLIVPGSYAKEQDWEGAVVRRFRRPDVNGGETCALCGQDMNNHGWIDTLEAGHIVCVGDFIITGIKGERYPCKPDIFAATYELVQ